MEPDSSYLWRLSGEALALCFRAAPNYEARLTQHASLILSGEPVADLNFAILDAGSQAEDRLREFGQVLQARNIPAIAFLTDDVSDQLAPVARDLGLKGVGHAPIMMYRPDGARFDSGRFEVERVRNQEGLTEANRVMAGAYGIPVESVDRTYGPMALDGPGVEMFLARENGKAICSVSTTRTGSTVGIWAMGTLPEHQRKGAGRALLNHVIADHRGRGADLFYLGATEAGKPLYERIGFRTVGGAAIWVAGLSTQFSSH